MLHPFFTVAIPAFKDTYLKECLDSVLAQTYSEFEIVIVNDASPFDLDSIVESFKDPRIRYFKNEQNTGPVNVVNNWNKCLEYAKGDYIICMGDDDLLLPCCLKEYVELITKYPGLGVYHARTEIIDEQSRFINVTASRVEFESVYSFIWHRWNGREQQYVGDFLYDVRVLKANGGFFYLPLAWGSDDITAIIAAKEKGIANTLTPCFQYRINSNTISNTGNTDIKLRSIVLEQEWMDTFLEQAPIERMDNQFYQCIKLQFHRHYDKKKGLTIASDLRSKSVFRVFKWLFNRSKYALSARVIVYSVIESRK